MTDGARAEVKRRLRELPSSQNDLNSRHEENLFSFGIAPISSENFVLQRLWKRALSSKRIEPPEFGDLRFDNNHLIAKARGSLTRHKLRSAGPTRVGSSGNWSGAYVLASRYRRFTSVGARWTVPKAKPPSQEIEDTYQVAIWVGLDGRFRRSKSLPQAGTTQTIAVRNGDVNRHCTVWFQWWLRSELNPPVTFDPKKYPAKEEDEIISILTVDRKTDHVHVLMANLTESWAAPLLYDGSDPAGLKVEGSTAEWIVERPTRLDSPDSLYPLPNYGKVSFLDCATCQAHDPPSGDPGDLTGARHVRMGLDVTGPPHRSAIISRPKKLSASSLEVDYQDP